MTDKEAGARVFQLRIQQLSPEVPTTYQTLLVSGNSTLFHLAKVCGGCCVERPLNYTNIVVVRLPMQNRCLLVAAECMHITNCPN